MLIYRVTERNTRKQYIGQTTRSLDERWKDHLDEARRPSKSLLHRAIKKYGKENFTVEELKFCNSIEELNFFERQLIIEFNTLDPAGYNLHSGGNWNRGYFSPETKKRMSESHRGVPHPHVPGQAEKISKALKGKSQRITPARIAASLAKKGVSTSLKGKTLVEIHGEEKANKIREKYAAAKRGKSRPFTEDHKAKLASASERPEVKKKRSESQKAVWQNPDERKKRIDGLHRANQNPEVSQKRMEGINRANQNPEVSQRRSDATKKLWDSPEYRQLVSEKVRISWIKRRKKKRADQASSLEALCQN